MKATTTHTLGYAGLLPFAAGAILIWPRPALGLWLLASYGAIILSFMAGSLWGRALETTPTPRSLIVSNLIALSGWAALACAAAGYPVCALSGLALAFVACWQCEQRWVTPRTTYRQLRQRLTLGVLIGLTIGLAALLFR